MITLTPDAASKVGELLTQEGEEGLALRVAVRPGGCSGFSYEMYFDTEVNDNDQSAEFEGVDVIVDQSSAMLLQGASLQNAGFSIDNPNAQRTCGCGQSFS
ncbi:MAG: iron-sulfur cluster assembly accessory protein [Acidimicrobiia bacterium]|nr:iron-sulfur cluster assembly accessory protein [Acidimicrobiia bacterium]